MYTHKHTHTPLSTSRMLWRVEGSLSFSSCGCRTYMHTKMHPQTNGAAEPSMVEWLLISWVAGVHGSAKQSALPCLKADTALGPERGKWINHSKGQRKQALMPGCLLCCQLGVKRTFTRGSSDNEAQWDLVWKMLTPDSESFTAIIPKLWGRTRQNTSVVKNT